MKHQASPNGNANGTPEKGSGRKRQREEDTNDSKSSFKPAGPPCAGAGRVGTMGRKDVSTPNYEGPTASEVAKLRAVNLAEGLYTFYKEPVMLVEGAMQYLYDEKGQRYLDAYNNVQAVGHCHPHVTAAVTRALSTSGTINARYLHPHIGEYAKKLTEMFPQELDTCIFVNSGSEANDLAVRLSRNYTQRSGVVALQNAYHGVTGTCTGLSTCLAPGMPAPGMEEATGGLKSDHALDHAYYAKDVRVAPTPDNLRGPFKYSNPKAGRKYAKMLSRVIDESAADQDVVGKPWQVACFIHESVQGVGGQVEYPEGYLQSVYSAVRERGGICIADEVQVGFGRTGTSWWAFESQGVVPDIVTLGKPIGNGVPLAAVVCRKEIAKAFSSCQFFSTTGGNPVSCAAGLAVLEIVQRDGLRENARIQSELLRGLLNELQTREPAIAEVRGLGLFLGVEIVKPNSNLAPDGERARVVMERCKQLGVLVGKGGPWGNVIRIKPPLCLTEEDTRTIARVLEQALRDTAEQKDDKGE